MRSGLLLLALLVTAAARPASAEVALDDAGKLRLSGDLRFRIESDWSSTQPDGTERSARDRARLRARLRLEWTPTRTVSLGLRVRTGHHDAQASPHVTLYQLQSGTTGNAELLLDQCYLEVARGRGWTWIGKSTSPFWRQGEHLFDDDVPFKGVAAGYEWKPGGDRKARHAVTGAYVAVPDGPVRLDTGDRGTLAAAQYVVTRGAARHGGDWTIAGGLFAVRDEEGAANPVLLDQDFTIWQASVQRKLAVAERPLRIGLDVLWNSESPPASTWNRSQRGGQVLSVAYGQLEAKSDWVVAFAVARVEKLAVVPYLAQDDWMRWGSATQTRSSNYLGEELHFGWAFGKSTNVQARLFHVEGLELESQAAVAKDDGMRFRVDLNWKF